MACMCAEEAVGNAQCQECVAAKVALTQASFVHAGRGAGDAEDRRQVVQVIQGDEDDEITKRNLTPLSLSEVSVVSHAPLPKNAERSFPAKIVFSFLLYA